MFSDKVAETCADGERLNMLTAKQNKNVNVSACSSYCNDSPECKFFSLRDPEQVCNLYSSCNLPSESNPSYIISTYEKGTEYVQ